ncbi:MAG: serine protease [Firmicutes bacterium]|nr:serine protease [Bacillota bacterium]
MKKLYLIFILIFNILILQGCKSNYDFDFQAPSLDEYQINDINFEPYVPSIIEDFESIDEDELLKSKQGNILINNVSFDNEWFFSTKNIYSGSGVIFHETEDYYYAITNYHVVDKHKNYKYQIIEVVDYFENKYSAFVYEGSMSYELDLAIIVFSKTETALTILEIVDGEIEVGNNIIAIGNPLGERNVVSIGSVFKYNKTKTTDRYGEVKTNEFLSVIHSAETNSGSSGGMLLNFDLKVVGINYAGTHDENNPGGFSVSSKMVIDYIEFLISSSRE